MNPVVDGPLPTPSPDKIGRVLRRNGLVPMRKAKHGFIWVHPDDPTRRTQVPTHKTVARGTLQAIIRDSKKTAREFSAA